MDCQSQRTISSRKFSYLVSLIMIFAGIGDSFDVYWNVPSQICRKFGVQINASAFGMIQNTDDVFYGDKVTILYTPGRFPWYNGTRPVYGGIPQKGDIANHIKVFREAVQKRVPLDFKGPAVLDFETYYPSYDMSKPIYREESRIWVRSQHPDWLPAEVEAEAKKSFNDSAKAFFEVLLWEGRAARPNAMWGYYHYPYCHNGGAFDDTCRPEVMSHNDQMGWLINASTALYPSIYIYKNGGFSPRTRRRQAYTRIKEALRVRRNIKKNTPILPYLWYRYHDAPVFLSSLDLTNTLGLAKVMKLKGIIIWGAGFDMTSKNSCLNIKSYVENNLGPLVQYIHRYSRSILKRVINSRRLLKKFARAALIEASLGVNMRYSNAV